MSYEKYKDTIKATNEARRTAIRELINAHRAEFDEIYIRVATERGLNPTKIVAQVAKAAAEREKQQEMAEAVQEAVAAALSERGL